MEIVRGNREALASLPLAEPEEVTGVKFENISTSVELPGGDNAVVIPYDFVIYCGKFNTVWTYEVDGKEYRETHQNSVIQPLFTPEELKAFDPDFDSIDDSSINRLERVIRAVIERITGQKFELTYGTEIAKSFNGGSLVLPKRSVALDGYSGTVAGVHASVQSDGWVVKAFDPRGIIMNVGVNPVYDSITRTAFADGEYRLRGEWGYRTVPEQINLAAMLLASDYGCRESTWRDRYVEQIKNVDWGVTFHDRAFLGTGNIKVDKILEAYTMNNMVVI